jgi:hypothetical protein
MDVNYTAVWDERGGFIHLFVNLATGMVDLRKRLQ